MDQLICQSMRNCGNRFMVDNFYMSEDVIRFFFGIKSQLVGTARSGRFGRFFKIQKVTQTQNRTGRPKDDTLFERVMGTGKFKDAWSNANFQRKVLVFKVTLREGEFYLYFYYDKQSKVRKMFTSKTNIHQRKPVLFCNSAPFNFNDREGTNCSRYLVGKEKPKIVQEYNTSMGSIDLYDQAMGKYGLFQTMKRKHSWDRRMTTDFLDVMFNNTYCIWKTYQKVFLKKVFSMLTIFQKKLANLTVKQFEAETDRSEWYDDIALQMFEKKQVPVFPSRPETQSPRDRRMKRCATCVAESGAKKAKQSKDVCFQCQKSVCHVHSQKICSTCLQDLPLCAI